MYAKAHVPPFTADCKVKCLEKLRGGTSYKCFQNKIKSELHINKNFWKAYVPQPWAMELSGLYGIKKNVADRYKITVHA